MLKKISFAIIALAILLTGVIALRKLNYWESSIWIFKLNPVQATEGRSGQGQGYGRGRGEFRDERRPDRAEGFEGRQRPGGRFEGFRSHGGGGRGDFRGGKKINLGNVLWYLASFAAFTVAAIYTDKLFRLFRRRKKTDQCQ